MAETLAKYVDFGWGRPGGKGIRQAGFTGVIRYLSRSTTKQLDVAEYHDYQNNGLAVLVVFEDGAKRPLAGWQAGFNDAMYAVTQLRRITKNDAGAIYFAVDFDTGKALSKYIVQYFEGIRAALPVERVGVYGGEIVLHHLHRVGLAKYRWRTAASSWDHIARGSCDIQQLPGYVYINGVQTDANNVFSTDVGAISRERDLTVLDERTLRAVLNEATGMGQKNWPDTVKETLSVVQGSVNHAASLLSRLEEERLRLDRIEQKLEELVRRPVVVTIDYRELARELLAAVTSTISPEPPDPE